MFLLNIFIIILVLSLILYYFKKILRKLVGVEKQKRIIYEPAHKSQLIGERVLLVLFIFSVIILMTYPLLIIEPYILIITYLLILNLFRSFMEWKFQKESKEYIVTLSSSLFFIIMYFIIKSNVIDFGLI